MEESIKEAEGYQYKGRFYATHNEAVLRKVRDDFREKYKSVCFGCGCTRVNAIELMYILDHNREAVKYYLEITEGLVGE